MMKSGNSAGCCPGIMLGEKPLPQHPSGGLTPARAITVCPPGGLTPVVPPVP